MIGERTQLTSGSTKDTQTSNYRQVSRESTDATGTLLASALATPSSSALGGPWGGPPSVLAAGRVETPLCAASGRGKPPRSRRGMKLDLEDKLYSDLFFFFFFESDL